MKRKKISAVLLASILAATPVFQLRQSFAEPGGSPSDAIPVAGVNAAQKGTVWGKVYVSMNASPVSCDAAPPADIPLPDVPIIYRWMDKDGSISPYYKTSSGSDGSYFIKMPSFTTNINGKEVTHNFVAGIIANYQQIQMFIDPEWFKSGEGAKYQSAFNSLYGNFGGINSIMSGYTTWESVQQQVKNFNILVQKKPNLTLHSGTPIHTQPTAPLGTNYKSFAELNRVRGIVFYDWGYTELCTYSPAYTEGDRPIKGKKVTVTVGNKSGGGYQTFTTTTNAEGIFDIDLKDKKVDIKQIYVSVEGIQDATFYTPFATQEYYSAPEVGGAIGSLITQKLYSLDFAYKANPEFNIVKYDTTGSADTTAYPGYQVSTSTTKVAEQSGPYTIRWVKPVLNAKGEITGTQIISTSEPLYPDNNRELPDFPMYVPATLEQDTIYRAELVSPTGKVMQLDSFLAKKDAPQEKVVPAPVINPVTSDDKVITGTAPANSTVTVTLPNGAQVTATTDANGAWSAPLPSNVSLAKDQTITAKTTVDGKDSVESNTVVTQKPTPKQSELPTIDTINTETTNITGTGTPGSKVTVTVDGKSQTVDVNSSGTWTSPVPSGAKLDAGDTVSATQTTTVNGNALESSAPSTTKVIQAVKQISEVPVINPVNTESKKITGTGKPGSTVTVTIGSQVITKPVENDNTWSIPVSELTNPLTADTNITATQTETGKDPSSAINTVVTPAPVKNIAPPTINPAKQGDTSVKGSGQPDTNIKVTIDGTSHDVTTNTDGSWELNGINLQPGATIEVTQTVDGKTQTATTTVPAVISGTLKPPTIDPVRYGIGNFTGTAEPNASITIVTPEGDFTGKADSNGKYKISIGTTVLKDGDVISATQTVNGQKSAPATTTFTKDGLKQNKSYLPPSIDNVSTISPSVSGTGVEGSPIKVTLQDGTLIGETTVGNDGKWTVPVPSDVTLQEGNTVTVVATNKNNNVKPDTGTASTTVYKDTTPAKAPTITQPKAGDTKVSGTNGTPGAKITVVFPNGGKETATVQSDGTWEVQVPSGETLVPDNIITATETYNGQDVLSSTQVSPAPVTDQPSAPPTINPVTATSTQITGTGEKGATISVTYPTADGDVTKKVTVDKDTGKWTVPLDGDTLSPGGTISAKQDIDGTNDNTFIYSPEVTTKVPQQPVAQIVIPTPTISTVKAEDKVIQGKGEVGATVTVTLPDGTETIAVVDNNKNWIVNVPPTMTLKETQEIKATQTPNGGTTPSAEIKTTIIKKEEPTQSNAPTIDPMQIGATTVSGTGDQGSKITLTIPASTNVPGATDTILKDIIVGNDGKWKATIPPNTIIDNTNNKVIAVQTTTTSTGTKLPQSGAVTATIPLTDPNAQTSKSAQPVVNPPIAGETTITGKGAPDSTITVTVPDPNDPSVTKTITATVDEHGDWTATVPQLKTTDNITVTQKTGANIVSDEVSVTPKQVTKSDTPKIDEVSSEDKNITGTGKTGATVTVTVNDNNPASAKVVDGTWAIPITTKLDGGETITAVQKDGLNTSSDPASVTVKEETKVSNPPTITTPSVGATTVSGTGTPGSEIELTLPGGHKVTTTVKDESYLDDSGKPVVKGTWTVPLKYLVDDSNTGKREIEYKLNPSDTITATQHTDGMKISHSVSASTASQSGGSSSGSSSSSSSSSSENSGGSGGTKPNKDTKKEDAKSPQTTEKATIQNVTDNLIKGTTTPNSSIKAYDKDNKLIGKTKSDEDGKFSLEMLRQVSGTRVKLQITDENGNQTVTYIEIGEAEIPLGTITLNRKDHMAYMVGYPDKTFRPSRSMTRAELAAVLYNISILPNAGGENSIFKDIKPMDWFAIKVNVIGGYNVMSGYEDKSFRPLNGITREEFASVMARFIPATDKTNPFSDSQDRWSSDAIGALYQAGYITGYPDGTFKPEKEITRAEVASIINKMLDRKADSQAYSLVSQHFTDVNENHWAYNDIIEATNSHDYKRRDSLGIQEDWTENTTNKKTY